MFFLFLLIGAQISANAFWISSNESSRLDERGLLALECDGTNDMTTVVYQAAALCHAMIQAALALIDNMNGDQTFLYMFEADDPDTLGIVKLRLQQADNICSSPGSTDNLIVPFYIDQWSYFQYNPITWTHTEANDPQTGALQWEWHADWWFTCAMDVDIAFANPITNQVVLCPLFYDNAQVAPNPNPDNCWQRTRGDIIIHELMHVPAVVNSGPWGSPDYIADYAYAENILRIWDPAIRLKTADAYSFFALRAFLGKSCLFPADTELPANPPGAPIYQVPDGTSPPPVITTPEASPPPSNPIPAPMPIPPPGYTPVPLVVNP